MAGPNPVVHMSVKVREMNVMECINKQQSAVKSIKKKPTPLEERKKGHFEISKDMLSEGDTDEV